MYPHIPPAVQGLFWDGINYCRNAQGERSQFHLSGLIHEMICNISEEYSNSLPHFSQSCIAIKSHLDNLISKNPEKPFSLDEVCDELRLSNRQIVRMFKREQGVTPHDYYVKLKMSQAKRYLKSTQMSVKDISYLLGFCDPYHFSKSFKLHTSVSPTQYRYQ